MDANYWDLFWTTGMPEAWLMSRDGPGPRQSGSSKGGEMPSGPLAGFQPRLSSTVPGGPEQLY